MRCFRIVALVLGLMASAVHAHHSRSNFQLNETIRVKGVVTEFRWGNPHLYIKLRDEAGQDWLLEGHSIPGVMRLGWSKQSIVPGEVIEAGVHPDRERPATFALLDWVVNHEGEALRAFAASRIPPDVAGPPRVRPAVRVPPQSSMSFTGNWRVDFSGVDLRVAGFSPARHWPLTEAGRAQLQDFDLDNDPALDCVPRALPGVLKSAYGYRFDQFDDKIVMRKEHDFTDWTIWLNKQEVPLDAERNRFGYSIGTLSSHTLTFVSSNFVADKWGLTRGIDSSPDKRVKARYALRDDGLSIDFEYVVFDPQYLTEPVTVTGKLLRESDRPFIDEPCSKENARMHLLGDLSRSDTSKKDNEVANEYSN